MDYEVERFLRQLESGTPAPDNARIIPHGQRPCPICGAKMVVDHEEGIQTDVCSQHGVWLDLDELRVIISRVRSQDHSSKLRAVREAKREGMWTGATHGIWAFLHLD